jgi:hypothetical protein
MYCLIYLHLHDVLTVAQQTNVDLGAFVCKYMLEKGYGMSRDEIISLTAGGSSLEPRPCGIFYYSYPKLRD